MTRYITDIERLKKLELVMERLGVQPVDYFIYAKHPVLPCWVLKSIAKKEDHYFATEDQATYDYAALESVLPDIENDKGDLCIRGYRAFHDEIFNLILLRGTEKLNAMCDLILLLDENGIELRRCESE